MEKAKIYDQHAENTEFVNKLTFYKEEISILENRLEEIATKNNSKECLAELEKFQNQLIVQRNNIDEIKHVVVIDEARLVKEVEKNMVAVDHRHVEFHAEEKEAVESFETNFNELRKDLNAFFSKWM